MQFELSPQQTVEDFLAEREGEVNQASHRNYKYTLQELIRFCEKQDIEQVGELHGYHLKKFKSYRREQGIKQITLKDNLSTLRVFLRWCEQAESVEKGFAELVQLPTLNQEDRVGDTVLSLERIEDILDYFYKYEYATRSHAVFQLMWHTRFRIGTVLALDVEDYMAGQKQTKVRHRPETDAPLKNGMGAERVVNLSDRVAEVLKDYIDLPRHKVTDEHGREPLFTTKYGRLSGELFERICTALLGPAKSLAIVPMTKSLRSVKPLTVRNPRQSANRVAVHIQCVERLSRII